MYNKPKYSLLKNSRYALKGLKLIFKNETSFKIEIFILILLLIFLFYIKLNFIYNAVILGFYFLILIIEAVNSAIELIVDFISPKYNKIAGSIKDIASFAVFLSIVNFIIVFSIIIINKN